MEVPQSVFNYSRAVKLKMAVEILATSPERREDQLVRAMSYVIQFAPPGTLSPIDQEIERAIALSTRNGTIDYVAGLKGVDPDTQGRICKCIWNAFERSEEAKAEMESLRKA